MAIKRKPVRILGRPDFVPGLGGRPKVKVTEDDAAKGEVDGYKYLKPLPTDHIPNETPGSPGELVHDEVRPDMLGRIPPPPSSAGFPSSPFAYASPLPSTLLRPLQQPLFDTEILERSGLHGNNGEASCNELRFFQRQLGQTTAYGGLTKTEAETNLQQPGQLANPLEFSLFGFSIYLHGCTREQRAIILGEASIRFSYTGNRTYLAIPGILMPDNQGRSEELEQLIPMPGGPTEEGPARVQQQEEAAEGAMRNLNRQRDDNSPQPLNRLISQIVHEQLERQNAPSEPLNIEPRPRPSADRMALDRDQGFYRFTIGRSCIRIRPTESFQMAILWPNLRGAPMPEGLDHVRIQMFMHGLQWTPF